jgi:hypothetical protein
METGVCHECLCMRACAVPVIGCVYLYKPHDACFGLKLGGCEYGTLHSPLHHDLDRNRIAVVGTWLI